MIPKEIPYTPYIGEEITVGRCQFKASTGEVVEVNQVDGIGSFGDERVGAIGMNGDGRASAHATNLQPVVKVSAALAGAHFPSWI